MSSGSEKKKPLWQRKGWQQFFGAMLVGGIGLGATCRFWPEEYRGTCVNVSQGLQHLGRSMLALPPIGASSAADAGS